ncbi:anti-sigma factor antagonist [Streptomyces sp. NPDC086783]|uniref:anti-sigma factor antagonist n=1 Tax=Streptomyces sp. NPDC086783 TaxID=3365758 RepID=UPI0037F58A8C
MRQEPAPLTRQLRIRRYRGHTVLELHGEIDISAALDLVPLMDAETGRPDASIVIDLRPVEFFDCSGLRLLYRARHRVVSRGGELRLVCTHPLTLRIIRVTGLARVLPPAASLAEAVGRTEAAAGSSPGSGRSGRPLPTCPD